MPVTIELSDDQLTDILNKLTREQAKKAVAILKHRFEKEKFTEVAIPLADLNLSKRTMNALRAANLTTVEDVLRLGAGSLFSVKKIGPVVVKEVDTKIFSVYS
jgi:DNA-directed RNA polymerase alpha subunit